MAINTHGGGARTNQHGLLFEQQTSLRDALINAGYAINARGIVSANYDKCIGIIAQQRSFYKVILEPEGVRWEDRISKPLYPDDAFLNFRNRTLYIIEKKFQHGSGSVDEKLQTCDFKKKQYQKLLRGTGYDVEYVYVCNDFFKNPKYADVHEYINDVGCHIFFNRIPLDFLNL